MGFLNPLNLFFGLSLAALVAIYLRARSRPAIDVSSLMLFEEVPAPVTKSRFLRVDLFFWLELTALAALTLAVAGLYFRRSVPVGPHRNHALIFDLGASMGAFEEHANTTRLESAKQAALELVNDAPPGDEFSVIGYSVEAVTFHARSARKDEIRTAIQGLTPAAVAPAPAALRAALLDARGSAQVDLFTDHAPSNDVISDAQLEAPVSIHQLGAPAGNLAITSLDPGQPGSGKGRCVIRSFSMHPQACELRIESGGERIFDSSFIVEPRGQIIVPFGPLPAGGLVHVSIVTRDALPADNDRYAIAPSIALAHALVMSPEPEVRDDIARILLAINPKFIVTALDPSHFSGSKTAAQHYDLAVLHDCSDAGVDAAARLFIFPEPWLERSKRPPLVPVLSSVAVAELRSRAGSGIVAGPVILGPSRVVAVPGWMDPLATGVGAGEHSSFPLAAVGRNSEGAVGVIAFDIRNHLLLDPDRMDALLLTIETLNRLLAPQNLMVVRTGDFVAVSTFGRARVVAPDGKAHFLVPDQWGRVRFRPLEAGRYQVESGRTPIAVLANYYDAAESDLAASSAPLPHGHRASAQFAGGGSEAQIEPVTFALVALVLLIFLAESALLVGRAARWGMRHV